MQAAFTGRIVHNITEPLHNIKIFVIHLRTRIHIHILRLTTNIRRRTEGESKKQGNQVYKKFLPFRKVLTMFQGEKRNINKTLKCISCTAKRSVLYGILF